MHRFNYVAQGKRIGAAFRHCDKIAEKINLKEKKTFYDSSPWSLVSVVSGPVGRQDIVQGHMVEQEAE